LWYNTPNKNKKGIFKMSDEKHTCCICKGIFFGYGNNPEPVESEGRCCDDCNNSHVIAARIGNLGIIPTDKEIEQMEQDRLAKEKEGEEYGI
jgi:hypothetical protein